MEAKRKTARQAAEALRRGEEDSLGLTRAALERIRQGKDRRNNFALVTEGRALDQAEEADRRLGEGEGGPLTGIPVAVQDNLCVRGVPLRCGSNLLEGFVPPYDGAAAESLAGAGAVFLGTLNMDEFALSHAAETSCFGPVPNPWDLSRTAGGGAGGVAGAVAAGEALLAVGADTGGGLRLPCSHCGVTGIKPTYGLVSRWGLAACAPSMDTVGVAANTAADCAQALDLLGGFDRRDATSSRRKPPDCSGGLAGGLEGLAVGVLRPCFDGALDSQVGARVLAAVKTLEALGARVEECDFAGEPYVPGAFLAIAAVEAASSLGRYDGVRLGVRAEGEDLEEMYRQSRSKGLGPLARQWILLGSHLASAARREFHYHKAAQVRRMIGNELEELLTRFDLLLSPCAGETAPLLGRGEEDPWAVAQAFRYTAPASLAGLPALTMPCGFGETGLPIGLQLVGRAFEEPVLLRAAHAFQLHTDCHVRQPKGGML